MKSDGANRKVGSIALSCPSSDMPVTEPQTFYACGELVMGIKTEQALAPLCDLGRRQIAMMGATIMGIAFASLLLFS